MKGIRREKIENYSGEFIDFNGRVPYLREGFVRIEKDVAISGDAPKLFIRVYEYGVARKDKPGSWPAFIAKVGHKWYPVESITEQIFTDLGKLYGLTIADSKLMLGSGQLRFLSRYFLEKNERLMHGAEIYAAYLSGDQKFVDEVENEGKSPEFFTLTFTHEALKHSFPEHYALLFEDLLNMLTFDAITGNNDRHHYNWGVITDLENQKAPRFAPIYDTARGLFWNHKEEKIKEWCRSSKSMSMIIESYGKKSSPKMGIENLNNLNHFDFFKQLCQRFPGYNEEISALLHKICNQDEGELMDTNFRSLISEQRKRLIVECLKYRKHKLLDIVKNRHE